VVDVCRSDFEPAELDILQTEGLSQGSGLVQIEISLDDKDFGSWQDADTCTGLDRYRQSLFDGTYGNHPPIWNLFLSKSFAAGTKLFELGGKACQIVTSGWTCLRTFVQ
jgi:hypothetical protein